MKNGGMKASKVIYYVVLSGITRAKNQLYLTCSKQRTMFDSTSCNPVSRFLKEIPEQMIMGAEELNTKSSIS